MLIIEVSSYKNKVQSYTKCNRLVNIVSNICKKSSVLEDILQMGSRCGQKSRETIRSL